MSMTSTTKTFSPGAAIWLAVDDDAVAGRVAEFIPDDGTGERYRCTYSDPDYHAVYGRTADACNVHATRRECEAFIRERNERIACEICPTGTS